MESELSQQLGRLNIDRARLSVPDEQSASTTPCSTSFTGSIPSTSLTAASSTPSSDDESTTPCCEIQSTPDRGQALFSARRIRPGTLIFAEEPLIALSKELEESYEAIEAAFSALSKREKKAYGALFDAKKSRMSTTVSIYYSNCYSTESFVGAQVSDNTLEGGSCIGKLSSRINHSCVPNVCFSFLPPSLAHRRGQMRFYAIKAISKGKELLSNYDKSIFETSRRRQQKYLLHYGFRCTCEACLPQTDFWTRSDERRRAMRDAVSSVKGLEKKWQKAFEEDDATTQVEVCRGAVVELLELQGLLVKEGLTAVPLANAYRSLVKWSERGGLDAQQWREKELEVSILMSGKKSLRSVALKQVLDDNISG